jgi:general secretion pathway protein A
VAVYEQFFGLEDEPFRLTPDTRYLFLSAKHAEALAHLRLGLTESSGFVCITGDVGTGKTMLLRVFLSELGPDVAAAYALTPPLSTLDLLRRICREFGVVAAGESQTDLVDALHAYLIAQDAAGRCCVVVLDEAQGLSVDLLEQVRLLLNLETQTRKLLRIILVGQPQLRKLLLNRDLAQLNQRITLRWHLGPLSSRETLAYVHHRLAVASGGRATRLFTTPALRLLHSVSGGVPRIINMIAHRALLAAFVAREPRVTRRVVARAYREIQAVPLPGTLTFARKLTLAGGGLAIGASLVAVGAPQIDRLLRVTQSDAAAPRVVQTTEDTRDGARAAAAPAAPEASPVEPTVSGPTLVSVADVARRLTGLDPSASARAATGAILTAWGERALDGDETRLPENLEAVSWRRGLEELQLTANRSMLRLLDLPALLEVRGGASSAPCWLAMTRMDASQVVLWIDGTPVTASGDVLDSVWTGRASVLWRDFDGLGPTLRPGVRGVAVAHLQELLRRVGMEGVAPTGTFDAGTAKAVTDFQRQHRLDADGVVGPLTRIVLYAGAGSDHPRPALAIPGGAAS